MFLAVSPAATATLRHSSLNGMYTTTGITIGAIGQVQGSINWTQRHPPTWSLLGVSRDALMIGMMQIGAILGAIIAGTIADKFGRKISCAISGLCQAFGGLICLVDFFIPAASRGTGNTMLGYTLPFIMYFIGRFVAGVGVGMACHSVPMIVAELSPEHLRGPFDGAFQLFVCLGITTSFVLNLIILTLGEDVTNWWGSTGFLMPLGMPAISGMLMALTVYFFCPESPKWLLTNTTEGGGGSAAARSALGKCRWGSDESTDAEYHRMVQAKRREEIESEGEEVGWLDLFSVGYFKIVAIAFGICWLQVFIGIDIMTTYNVPVFVNLGFTPKTANITTVVVGVVMLIAVIPSLFLVEVLGRKTLLIWGSIGHIVAIGGAGACALGVQLSCKGYPGDPSDVATYGIMDHWCEGNTTLPVLKWVGLVCCMGWVIAFALSWGPVAWVVPSEMLPAAVRSKALTLCVLGNWVSDYIVVASFPALM